MNRTTRVVDSTLYPWSGAITNVPEGNEANRRARFYRRCLMPFPDDLNQVHDRLWADVHHERVASDTW